MGCGAGEEDWTECRCLGKKNNLSTQKQKIYKMKSGIERRNQSVWWRENQRLNRKAVNEEKRGEMQSCCLARVLKLSPQLLPSLIYSRLLCLTENSPWLLSDSGPAPCPSAESWLADAAQHCIAGEGWPPPSLHLTKITLFLVRPRLSNTRIIIIDHFVISNSANRFSLQMRCESHAAHPPSQSLQSLPPRKLNMRCFSPVSDKYLIIKKMDQNWRKSLLQRSNTAHFVQNHPESTLLPATV